MIICTFLRYCHFNINSGYSINYHQIRQQWAVFIPHFSFFNQMQMCFLYRYHHMPVISISIDLSSFGIFTRNTHCDWSPYCMNTMWVNTILSIITLFEYFIYLLLFCSTNINMYQPSFDHYELNCHHQSVFWSWQTLLNTLFLYLMNTSLYYVK